MQPMTCQELVELVTAYFERTLSADDQARFERHVGLCPGCATYVEQMRQTITLVGGLREEHVSLAAQAHLAQAFRDWKQGGAGD